MTNAELTPITTPIQASEKFAMNSQILIVQNSDGNIKIDVRSENETVWLTQEQMALLFGKAKSTINEHIQNIYQEGELDKEGTLQKFGNSEFQQKNNLPLQEMSSFQHQ